MKKIETQSENNLILQFTCLMNVIHHSHKNYTELLEVYELPNFRTLGI